MTCSAFLRHAIRFHLDYRLRAVAGRLAAFPRAIWRGLRTLAHDDNGEAWILPIEAVTLIGGFALMVAGVGLLLLY